ncbi:uncharacterized protein N7518_008951 [Penicillium psychrosexuale]|uniref:uncharacterized protein n=1 Tax=Penicillium psychrosexuale TaxID=1002107 RepID=UPI002545AF16|nr:uncharacterized protein N7518_008951 [Penicillium psychrosexuale]KAJ5791940.1 hypothetical protein N7518_008951 [Penicillium psychrosexuale]
MEGQADDIEAMVAFRGRKRCLSTAREILVTGVEASAWLRSGTLRAAPRAPASPSTETSDSQVTLGAKGTSQSPLHHEAPFSGEPRVGKHHLHTL